MRRVFLGIHRLLLRLLPPAFRAEFGEELASLVQRRLETTDGFSRTSATVLRELTDLLRTVLREWGLAITAALGGVVRGLGTDGRLAVRSLARSPRFSALAVAILAIAIGASTAIFSVIEGVLLRPLPYPEADRIVRVTVGARPESGASEGPFSPRGFWHVLDNNRAFEVMGAGGIVPRPLTGDGPPVQVATALMTRGAFEVIGLEPQLGRLPSPEEDAPGGPTVALISEGLWADRYGSDPAVIGRTIELGPQRFEVIGVMPAGYDYPAPGTDAWVARQLDPATENFRAHFLDVIARLAPNTDVDDAVADTERLIATFGDIGYGPEWFEGVFTGEAFVRPLHDVIIGEARRLLFIVFGTVVFLFAVGCANVANLILVRGELRRRDRAIRAALGAGRGRLVRHVLIESVLLAGAGSAIGVILAWVGTRVLVAAGPPSIPRLDEIQINAQALGFSACAAIVAAVLFGLLPALGATSGRVLPALRSGRRTDPIRTRSVRAPEALIVVQVAIAVVLLTASGLTLRSFDKLRTVDPGFEADGVLTFRLAPSPARYPNPEASARFYDRLMSALDGLPGVASAAGITVLPFTGGGGVRGTVIEEFPTAEGEFGPAFFVRRVTPGYFATMGIPIVEGRELTPADHNDRLGSLLISESIKRRYWPDESALGKRIQTWGAPARVVGVVGDVRDSGPYASAGEFVYKPMLDSVGGGGLAMTVVVRLDDDSPRLPAAIRSTVSELDAELPVTDLRRMEAIVADSMSSTTFPMALLSLAAGIALFLASAGIYGLLSYVVAQRRAEAGVRLALGADAASVRRIIVARGVVLASLGVAVGVGGAVAVGRMLDSLLFEVSPVDPATLVAVALVFLIVAACSSLVPAIRLGNTAPGVALRADA